LSFLSVMLCVTCFDFDFQAGKPSSSSQSPTQEYVVRAPTESAKKFSMIKFSTGTDIDFLKLTSVCNRY